MASPWIYLTAFEVASSPAVTSFAAPDVKIAHIRMNYANAVLILANEKKNKIVN